MVPRGNPGQRRYGRWSEAPFGYAENITRCVVSVYILRKGYISRQCLKPRGYGRNGEFCHQHAKQHPAIKETK